jgi:hypothetical protein
MDLVTRLEGMVEGEAGDGEDDNGNVADAGDDDEVGEMGRKDKVCARGREIKEALGPELDLDGGWVCDGVNGSADEGGLEAGGGGRGNAGGRVRRSEVDFMIDLG